MAYVKSGELAAFKALARSMYFSNEVVEPFCASAAAGQMRNTTMEDVIDRVGMNKSGVYRHYKNTSDISIDSRDTTAAVTSRS